MNNKTWLGSYYVQPVILGPEHGFSFASIEDSLIGTLLFDDYIEEGLKRKNKKWFEKW